MTKKKLSNSVLHFREKCPCGTEIEFESSTGMVFDKMMQRWDKTHAAHVENAAHPPVAIGVDPATDVTRLTGAKLMKAATDLEKEFLKASGVRPATTQAAKKTKKPSMVEMEEFNRKAWLEKSEYEKMRIQILQDSEMGLISKREAVNQMEAVNTHERWKQEQSKGDQGATTPEGDAASSRA